MRWQIPHHTLHSLDPAFFFDHNNYMTPATRMEPWKSPFTLHSKLFYDLPVYLNLEQLD
jgi:hypothetical protein